MNDNEAFLATIRANPHDTHTKLIYADFLEESGNAKKAELIRLDIEMERLEEQGKATSAEYKKLQKTAQPLIHQRCWELMDPDDLQYLRGSGLRHGFLDRLQLNITPHGSGIKSATKILQQEPVSVLILRESGNRAIGYSFQNPDDHGLLAQRAEYTDAAADVLIDNQFGGARLESVGLCATLGAERCERFLNALPDSLERLQINYGITVNAARKIAGFPKLHALSLFGDIPEDAMQALSTNRTVTDLYLARPLAESIRVMADSALAQSLQKLDINNATSDVVETLAGFAPNNMQRLFLVQSENEADEHGYDVFEPGAIRALAQSHAFPKVKNLSFGPGELTDFDDQGNIIYVSAEGTFNQNETMFLDALREAWQQKPPLPAWLNLEGLSRGLSNEMLENPDNMMPLPPDMIELQQRVALLTRMGARGEGPGRGV